MTRCLLGCVIFVFLVDSIGAQHVRNIWLFQLRGDVVRPVCLLIRNNIGNQSRIFVGMVVYLRQEMALRWAMHSLSHISGLSGFVGLAEA
jgi:hypothetical protein